jgi:Clp amino terminal domain, pathogenicity island component
MFERFTKPARGVVVAAQGAARRLGDDHVGDEHLLLGLLAGGAKGGGVAAKVLAGLDVTTEAVERELAARRPPPGRLGPADAEALQTVGIDLDAIRRRVEETFGTGALERVSRRRRGHLPFEKAAKRALEGAVREAVALGDRHIGSEHILLGLLRQPDGAAVAILRALGASHEDVRDRVLAELPEAS